MCWVFHKVYCRLYHNPCCYRGEASIGCWLMVGHVYAWSCLLRDKTKFFLMKALMFFLAACSIQINTVVLKFAILRFRAAIFFRFSSRYCCARFFEHNSVCSHSSCKSPQFDTRIVLGIFLKCNNYVRQGSESLPTLTNLQCCLGSC